MYRMVNQMVPTYLAEHLNDFRMAGDINTRGQVMGNLTPPACKTLMYKKSFICSGISLWNQLEPSIKGMPTFRNFKYGIKSKFRVDQSLTNYDVSRKIQIIFTQIRLGFSDLKGHLYRRGCTINGNCTCGAPSEHPRHYFLECPLYPNQRNQLFADLSLIKIDLKPTIDLLLNGSANLSLNDNMKVFQLVYLYIKCTNRFL